MGKGGQFCDFKRTFLWMAPYCIIEMYMHLFTHGNKNLTTIVS